MSLSNAQEELLDYEVDEKHGGMADGDSIIDEDGEVDAGLPAADVVMTDRKPVFAGHSSVHSTGFQDMMLKPELIRAISDAGFEHPSGEGGHGRF